MRFPFSFYCTFIVIFLEWKFAIALFCLVIRSTSVTFSKLLSFLIFGCIPLVGINLECCVTEASAFSLRAVKCICSFTNLAMRLAFIL